MKSAVAFVVFAVASTVAIAAPPRGVSPITNAWGEAATKKLDTEVFTLFTGHKGAAFNHQAQLAFHDGRLYATWSHGDEHEEDTGQVVMLATSDDFGKTWSKPRTVAGPERGVDADRTLMNTGIYVHGDTLVLYYGAWEFPKDRLTPNGRRAQHGGMAVTIRPFTRAKTSQDRGETWSESIPIMPGLATYMSPKPTASGRLILPGHATFSYTDDPTGLTGWTRAGVTGLADDFQDHWYGLYKGREKRNDPFRFAEGSFFQTDDRVIYMMLRVEDNTTMRLAVSQSRDNGQTWSDPVLTGYTSCVGRPQFGRLSDGRFFGMNCPDPKVRGPRTPAVLALSDDGVRFDEHYIVGDLPERKPRFPGGAKHGQYNYPYFLEVGEYGFVIYSEAKEDIKVSRFKMADLQPERKITNAWGDVPVKPLTPQLEKLVFRGYEGQSYSHQAQLTSHDGKLYATWSLGLRDEEGPGQRMVLAISEDRGESWSDPITVAPANPGEHAMSVVVSKGLRFHDGKLIAYYGEWERAASGMKPDGFRNSTQLPLLNARTEARVSDDGGQTWSGPTLIAPKLTNYFPPEPTATGRLILPGNLTYWWTDDPAGLTGWNRTAVPGIPDDYIDTYFHMREGRQHAGTTGLFTEANFYQTDDGVIHMMLRNGTTQPLGVTESRDDGETWTTPRVTEFTDNDCRAHFGRLPDGRHFAITCPEPLRKDWSNYRTKVVLALSDGGYRFDEHYLIAEAPLGKPRIPGLHKTGHMGYPYLHVMGEHLYVIYSAHKEDIVVRRYKLADIMPGELP